MATKPPSLDTIWHTPDALWNRIAPILVPEKQPGTVGRPPAPYRVIFDAIIFVLRSGCPWQVIPRQAYAPGSTVHGRFREVLTRHSKALIQIAMIHLLLKRIT